MCGLKMLLMLLCIVAARGQEEFYCNNITPEPFAVTYTTFEGVGQHLIEPGFTPGEYTLHASFCGTILDYDQIARHMELTLAPPSMMRPTTLQLAIGAGGEFCFNGPVQFFNAPCCDLSNLLFRITNITPISRNEYTFSIHFLNAILCPADALGR